jgi:hypothetical protein
MELRPADLEAAFLAGFFAAASSTSAEVAAVGVSVTWILRTLRRLR